MSTLKQAAFEATAIALHELGAKLVLVAQLSLVVAIAARRKLGSAAAAARTEPGAQLFFVVAVGTRRGPGTKVALVAAVAARRGVGNHGTVDAAWPNICASTENVRFRVGVG